jgi:anaerobic ribonucleoside-triphosphate reductase activating protein
MAEIVFLVDEVTGELTVEGVTAEQVRELFGDLYPPAEEFNCARPPALLPVPTATTAGDAGPLVRVFGVWHGSMAEGPGRRSVVQFAGCPIRCSKCLIPHTWPEDSGYPRTVRVIADALLDPGYERDGITVVGGEPFAQPDGLAALLWELRRREPMLHLAAYSGYTLEALARRPERAVHAALDLLGLLIDGPFVSRLQHGAGEWRGSTNQRIIPHPGRILAAGIAVPHRPPDAWGAPEYDFPRSVAPADSPPRLLRRLVG